MPDNTPPQSPPLPPPELQPESADVCIENPKPSPDSEDPCQNHNPSTPEIQNPPAEDPIEPKEPSNPDQEPQIVSDGPEQDDPEPDHEGMSVRLSPRPSISDTNSALESKGNPPVSSARRGPKRKKGFGKNHKSQLALEKKLQTLSQNLNPIPFVPGKVLDFSRYEELLKRVNLWEFAHIEFDRSIRCDLIAELVANYNPKQRASYVYERRIGVNRADMGRALKLPGKKAVGDSDLEEIPLEFLSFLEEFVSNWMLLHEDLWCTPIEVVTWLNLIKEGHLEKVDWAGLIWFMVEKELAQGVNLKNCYYASHLLQLIRMQREDLFLENVKVELMVDEDEDGGDVKMLDAEESSLGGLRLEDENVELKLGQDFGAPMENAVDADKVGKVGDIDLLEKVEEDVDKVENVHNVGSIDDVHEVENVGNVDEHVENADDADEHVKSVDNADEHVENVDNDDNVKEERKDVDMMDFGYGKGDEQGHWLLDGKTDGGQHFMQRCNMANVKTSIEDRRQDGVGENIEDEDDEEDDHVEGFKIMQKSPLDGMSSANLMQAFETGQLPYTSSDLGGQSSLELMSSRAENNVMLGGSSLFNNTGKRGISLEHDISHHALNDNYKKMRIDGSWDQKPPEYDTCFQQMTHWFEKTKMSLEASKAEAYQQASMSEQIMVHQIAGKDGEISQLRCKLDELQRRRQTELHHRDRELYLMNSVIDGYRRALKETQKAFAEFRKRYTVPDEPIYKDAGSGGVVKSIMELEKERIKQEEEKKMLCYLLEETYKKHVIEYESKWGELLAKVNSLDSNLQNAGKEVEQLKEHCVNRKPSGSAHNES